jgi:thiol:disulfide interchange protein DsbD
VYPTPERIVQGGIIAFGYTGELVVEYLVTPPEGFTPTGAEKITAALDWLVCKESCIPGERSLLLPLTPPGGPERSLAARLLATARRHQPQRLEDSGLHVENPRVTTGGARTVVSFTLRGERGMKITDFYPEPVEGFVLEHKDILVRDRVVTVPLTPYDRTSSLASLRGILLVENRGYTVHVTLP